MKKNIGNGKNKEGEMRIGHNQEIGICLIMAPVGEEANG